ncbi:hypothetical protein B0J14DRAFT_323904 [Halenospora varia]|nr:hypothetical protein B0J14DRAFT_323904 [Halenospora varia]
MLPMQSRIDIISTHLHPFQFHLRFQILSSSAFCSIIIELSLIPLPKNKTSQSRLAKMGFFDSRYKFAVHMLQLILVLLAIGGSAVRLLFVKAPGASPSRANTMALGMVSILSPSPFQSINLTKNLKQGAKSLIIILYQVITEHSARCRKWASLKANMILNSLEIVFWAAVVFLMIQANLKFCVGTNCVLSWCVCCVAGLLSIFAAYTATVSIMEWKYFKATGMHRGSEMQLKNEYDSEGQASR